MPWEAETTLELLLASRSTTQLPTSGLQGTRWYIHIPSLIHFNVVSQRQPRSAAAGVVLGNQIFTEVRVVAVQACWADLLCQWSAWTSLLAAGRRWSRNGWNGQRWDWRWYQFPGEGDGNPKEVGTGNFLEQSDCCHGWIFYPRHFSQHWRGLLPMTDSRLVCNICRSTTLWPIHGLPCPISPLEGLSNNKKLKNVHPSYFHSGRSFPWQLWEGSWQQRTISILRCWRMKVGGWRTTTVQLPLTLVLPPMPFSQSEHNYQHLATALGGIECCSWML